MYRVGGLPLDLLKNVFFTFVIVVRLPKFCLRCGAILCTRTVDNPALVTACEPKQ